jgi:hypothetical protein
MNLKRSRVSLSATAAAIRAKLSLFKKKKRNGEQIMK